MTDNKNVRAPEEKDIREAASRIAAHARRTPVMTCGGLDERIGANLYFKCENFQKVGAFKFRGAYNAVSLLSADEAKKGVTTHSSGNHAQALALAARLFGIKARIVMPENAPKVKIAAVKGYGADIIFCRPELESRESTVRKVMEDTGATLVHPYDDVRIIAGQGTCAMELLEERSDLDIVMAPVGGGGLLSGTALAVKYFSKGIRVIAAEPELADDARESFYTGKWQPPRPPISIADGLRTALGEITFPIVLEHVHDIVTTSEENIISAMKLIWERMKIIVEPSAAVPMACLMEGKIDAAGKKIGIILSGGNVDLEKLPWMVS